MVRMNRILLVLSIAAALLPATIRPASACSCAAVSPEDLAKGAKVVFTGWARSVTDDGTTLATRFRARIVYKGSVPAISMSSPRTSRERAASRSARGSDTRSSAARSGTVR